MEAAALRRRGWSIAAIARHLGRDRKTVRAHLRGARAAGVRQRGEPDALAPYVSYVEARLAEDPHLWATALHDELVELGFERSYVTFARQVRLRGVGPLRGLRRHARAADDRDPAPAGRGDPGGLARACRRALGRRGHLLVATLSHSGKCRAVFAEPEDQAHLVEALDAVLRRLGGSGRRWRFDRMVSVCDPDSGRITASFAEVAKHYGVAVDMCPARRANREGAVESRTTSSPSASGAPPGWGRSRRPAQARPLPGRHRRSAPARDDHGGRGDRRRAPAGAARRALPRQGNRYSVPSGLQGGTLVLRRRLGRGDLEVVSAARAVVARHRLTPPGAGALQRLATHHAALEQAVLAALASDRPCRRKANRPPGPVALAAAAALRATGNGEVVVDLVTPPTRPSARDERRAEPLPAPAWAPGLPEASGGGRGAPGRARAGEQGR